LMNVVMAGSPHPLRPVEALEHVVRVCEAGLGPHDDVAQTPLDLLFRRGF
jgi:hypothetical protein